MLRAPTHSASGQADGQIRLDLNADGMLRAGHVIVPGPGARRRNSGGDDQARNHLDQAARARLLTPSRHVPSSVTYARERLPAHGTCRAGCLGAARAGTRPAAGSQAEEEPSRTG